VKDFFCFVQLILFDFGFLCLPQYGMVDLTLAVCGSMIIKEQGTATPPSGFHHGR
jgi:hypothetical protein